MSEAVPEEQVIGEPDFNTIGLEVPRANVVYYRNPAIAP